MEEYSRIQIQEMCKLAMPNGLKDLMADISREVLRAQPTNLYSFIAQYLKALLRARESLCIASQLCCDICDDIPHPPLEEALRELGFFDDDVETIVRVVVKFFEKYDSTESMVKEDSLLARLIRKVEIPEDQIEDVIRVIRRCYLEHKLKRMPEHHFKCLGYSRSTSDVMYEEIAEEETSPQGPSKIKFGFSENYSDISIIKREDLHSYGEEDDDSSRARRYSEDTRTSPVSPITVKSPQPSEDRSTDSKEVEVNEVDYKVSIDQGNMQEGEDNIMEEEKPAVTKEPSNIRKSIDADQPVDHQTDNKKESATIGSDGNLKSISFHDKDERIVYDAAQEADDESNNSSVVDESFVPESEHDDDDYTSVIDDEIESPPVSNEKGDD